MPEQIPSDIPASTYIIVILSFIVALACSTSGPGGGSSCTAMMAIAGYSPVTIPMVSLMLDLPGVTSIGSANYIKHPDRRDLHISEACRWPEIQIFSPRPIIPVTHESETKTSAERTSVVPAISGVVRVVTRAGPGTRAKTPR